MLDPKYLANVGLELEKLYAELEVDILSDIARRIKLNDFSMTSTAEHQKAVLQALGMSQNEVAERIAKALDISTKKVNEIIAESAYKSVAADNEIFKLAFQEGLIPSFNYNKESLKALINEGIVATNGELKNICKTTAMQAQQALVHGLDKAYLAIQSGGLDYNTAITNVIKELSRSGLDFVDFESGTKRRIDSAIRNAVRTGVNQTACKCQDKNFIEMGGNLVETTSHMGARPDHARWQGGIYWRKEKVPGYDNFEIATGYGTGAGLGGWECRHSYFPSFPGLSTKSFETYRESENEDYYNLTQKQRNNERMIREWERRSKVCEAGGVDNSKEAAKLKEWKSRQAQLLEDNPELKRQYTNEKNIY